MADAPARAEGRGGRALLLALAALLVVRGFLALACADVYAYGEELAKGACAKAILDRPDVPYHQLVYAYHEGGGFVVAHLRALAFLVLGESLLAAKVVAIGTAATVLAATFALTREAFGRRAAIVLATLFVLCPDAWLRFSLLSLGTHFEALAFQAAILLLGLRIARDGRGSARDWFLLGLASGFGTYFSLVVLAAIATAGLVILVALRGRILGRGLASGIGGALLGATPLLWMLANVGLDAVRVRGGPVRPGAGAGLAARFADLFAPLARNGRADDWIQLVLLGGLALVAPLVVRDRRARLSALAIGAHALVYLSLYFGSGLSVDSGGLWLSWWRMCPVWLVGSVLAAAAIDAWLDRRRALAVLALALLVSAGAADLARVAATGRPDRLAANAAFLARAKGYDLSEYFDQIVHHLDGDEVQRVRALAGLRDDSHLLPAAIAHTVFEESDMPLDQVLAILRRELGPRLPDAALGLGHRLHPRPGYDIPAAFARIDAVPADLRPAFARAIGRTGLGQRWRRDRLVEQLEARVPAEHRESFLVGTGWRVWRAYLLDPEGGEAFVASRPPDEREALRRGLALERAAWTLP